MNAKHRSFPGYLLVCALAASCTQAASSDGDAGSGASGGTSGGTSGPIGDAENRYIEATDSLTQALNGAKCTLMTTLAADYESYYPAMTNESYKNLASTRFKPFVDYMSRKLCNMLEISGDANAYKSDAVANSPAGEFLSGTPLLQAIFDESSEVDGLLATANSDRSAQGLEPIIVADYPNSIVGGPYSTVVFFPGWPGRPELDQWVQVQRVIGQMFFISLEPREDGSYDTYLHGRTMTSKNGVTTVESTFANGTCLSCHYSGKPIHMGALDDAAEAEKVAKLVQYLQKYPAKTNHPDYNPFPDAPGIGTSGALTLEEATTYAGRTLTTEELATLNKNTSCNMCHNNTLQNALLPPFGDTIQILMKNGIMPPGSGVVDAADRTEAIKVMNAAYAVKLKRYFMGDE